MARDPSSKSAISFERTELHFPKMVVTGRHVAPYEDLYHYILTKSWAGYVIFVSVGFVLINVIFAALYMLSPGCIQGVGDFEQAFYFSVQTLGTIGYGGMSPQTRYGHLVVAAEALAGLMSTAMITGLTFTKFARPTAKVLFSRNAVISVRDGVPHLMFRMANWRHNQVSEARVGAVIMLLERTREGDEMRRVVDIPLVRDRTALFLLTFTAMHRIDESSPFFGDDAMDRLRAAGAEIYVGVSGVDETTSSVINARHRYKLDDIVIGARFKDVMSLLPDGTRHLDYGQFHEVEPVRSADDV
jgi:inward rectifier potassium channel